MRKGLFKKNIKKVLASTGLFATILSSGLTATPAFAKDASHEGMAYLQVQLSPSTHHIESNINGIKSGNDWFSSDIVKTQEYKMSGLTFAKASFDANKNTLKLTNFGVYGGGKESSSFEDAQFSDDTFADNWKKWVEDKQYGIGKSGTTTPNPQTENLVMSFPGFGGSNRAWDLAKASKQNPDAGSKDRNKDGNQYRDINATMATDSAQAVSDVLLADFNKALDEFYSRIEGGDAELSNAGMANMVWLVANGKFPKDGKKISYDAATGKLTGEFATVSEIYDYSNADKDSKTTKKVGKDFTGKVKAGGVVTEIITPDSSAGTLGGSNKYIYRVYKGYLKNGSDKSSFDNMYISWADIAMSATAVTVMNASQESSDNTTVVGDQVNSFVYDALSGALGLLGVKKADDLVYKSEGNLFRNGTWQIYTALMAPFVIIASVILGMVIIDAWRKKTLAYITTDNVQSIQSSIARVFNAVVMMLAAPTIIAILVYIDTQAVAIALGYSKALSDISGYASTGGLSTAIRGITGIIMAILLALINVKYTARYIARSITFGLYYMTSPLMFALDSLDGDGGLFQYGRKTGEIWKNLVGTIFLRTADAFGLVLALNLGRVIFGEGMLITILGYMSVDAITNALMSSFGITPPSTLKGIEQAGSSVYGGAVNRAKKVGKAAGYAVGAKAGAIGLAGLAGYAQQRKQNLLSGLQGNGKLADIDSEKSSKETSDKMKTSYDNGETKVSDATTDSPDTMPQTGAGGSLVDKVSDAETSPKTNGTGTSGGSGASVPNRGRLRQAGSAISSAFIGKPTNITPGSSAAGTAIKAAAREALNYKSSVGATFTGLSKITPGHIDDFIGNVMLAKNAERIINANRTDELGNPVSHRNPGFVNSILGAQSLMGRWMGVKQDLEIDTYEGAKDKIQQNVMKENELAAKNKVSLSPYKSESQIMADADNGGYFSDVVVNQSSLGKDDKEGYGNLIKVATDPSVVGFGNVDYLSRDMLQEKIVGSNGRLDTRVQSALGFMDKNGFTGADITDGKEAIFTKKYTEIPRGSSSGIDGALNAATQTLGNGETISEPNTNFTIVKSNSGGVKAFSNNPVDVRDGQITTARDMVSQRNSLMKKSDAYTSSDIKKMFEASTPRDFNNHLAQMEKARQEALGQQQQQQQQQSNEQENDGNGGMTLAQAESVTKPERN